MIIQEERTISFPEMQRRWAIAEINSEFCRNRDPGWRKKILSQLESENKAKQREGIKLFLQNSDRKKLIDSISGGRAWYLVSLPIDQKELDTLRTINYHTWNEYTKGTRRLRDAAESVTDNTGLDSRVRGIVCGLISRKIEMRGITCISDNEKGPYDIVEGNARLVAVYYHCILKKLKLFENDEIEIVLGVSSTK